MVTVKSATWEEFVGSRSHVQKSIGMPSANGERYVQNQGAYRHMAMGHNLWRSHFGVHEHPFASYFDVHQGYRVLTHSHLSGRHISTFAPPCRNCSAIAGAKVPLTRWACARGCLFVEGTLSGVGLKGKQKESTNGRFPYFETRPSFHQAFLLQISVGIP